eukprot:m.93039 g.93039  ORF g.93039 m.93039 type:complete len:185 (+) comp14971_c2_seq8:150-704(+)
MSEDGFTFPVRALYISWMLFLWIIAIVAVTLDDFSTFGNYSEGYYQARQGGSVKNNPEAGDLTHALNATRAFAVFYLLAIPLVIILLAVADDMESKNFTVPNAASIAAYLYWNIALICHAAVYHSRVKNTPVVLFSGNSSKWKLGVAFYLVMTVWVLHGATIVYQFYVLPREKEYQLGVAFKDD